MKILIACEFSEILKDRSRIYRGMAKAMAE